MTQRQTAHQVCSRLEQERRIVRDQRHCARCRALKICSGLPASQMRFNGAPPETAGAAPQLVEPPPAIDPDRPWHWEGHVQLRLQRWLEREGWSITQAVDTASKMQGVDLIAARDGRTLWVTVKGYPTPTARTNPCMQARHWFAGALMDVALYRGKSPDIEIAIGLPDGYKTYASLAKRTQWLRASCPFHILWASENGEVRTER